MARSLTIVFALIAATSPLWAQTEIGTPLEACKGALETGISEYKSGSLDNALTLLSAAIRCNSTLVEAGLAIAGIYARKGDETETLRAYTRVFDFDPKNVNALKGAAAIYLRNDNNEKAVPLLELLVELVPTDPQAHVDLGASYASTGHLDEAEQQFKEAIRLNPDNASALTGLGNLYQKNGHTEEATALLRKAIALAPYAFEPCFVLGSIYNAKGNYPEAVRELERSLKLGGNRSAEVYYQLARAYQNLGRDSERRDALAHFTRIYEDEKKNKESRNAIFVLTSKASTLVDAGDLKGAAADLEEASKLAPPDHQLLFRLAGLQYDLRQYEAARFNIQKAISMAPSVWLYHFLLGLIQTDSGRLPEARASLELAIHLNPLAAEAHNALGQIALQQKDWLSAIADFKRAVDLNPQQDSYQANLQAAMHSAKQVKNP